MNKAISDLIYGVYLTNDDVSLCMHVHEQKCISEINDLLYMRLFIAKW